MLVYGIEKGRRPGFCRLLRWPPHEPAPKNKNPPPKIKLAIKRNLCNRSCMTYENYRHWVRSRILSRSVRRENGCIEYCGDKPLAHEYGLISITIDGKRRSVPAHRALWMAVNDRFDLPRNIQIRHKCDNPRCVNEKHLIDGTAKANMRDKVERGRCATSYRNHTRQRVHGDDKIRAIRAAVGTTTSVAAQFGVSPGYVSKLKNGKAKALVA